MCAAQASTSLLFQIKKRQLLSHHPHHDPPVLELWPDMFKSLSIAELQKATHGQILTVGVCLCLCASQRRRKRLSKSVFASASSACWKLYKGVQGRRRNRAAVCTVRQQPGWRMQFIVKTNRPLSFSFFFFSSFSSLHAAFPLSLSLSLLDAACRRLLLLLLSLFSFFFFFFI